MSVLVAQPELRFDLRNFTGDMPPTAFNGTLFVGRVNKCQPKIAAVAEFVFPVTKHLFPGR